MHEEVLHKDFPEDGNDDTKLVGKLYIFVNCMTLYPFISLFTIYIYEINIFSFVLIVVLHGSLPWQTLDQYSSRFYRDLAGLGFYKLFIHNIYK